MSYTPNEFHLVDFACDKEDEPEKILISDAEHTRWCDCEPPKGYKRFKTLVSFGIERVTDECLEFLHNFRGEQPKLPLASGHYYWYRVASHEHPVIAFAALGRMLFHINHNRTVLVSKHGEDYLNKIEQAVTGLFEGLGESLAAPPESLFAEDQWHPIYVTRLKNEPYDKLYARMGTEWVPVEEMKGEWGDRVWRRPASPD